MANNFNTTSLEDATSAMPGMKKVESDESKTASGRLGKMLKSDSPLMKRAETQGKQYAQSRGLLNSSMAAGASQGAMIDRAQPFALQDSNNLMQNDRQNAAEENSQRKLKSKLVGDSYLSNQNYGQQQGLNEQKAGFQKQRDERLAGIDKEMTHLQAEVQKARDNRQFGYEKQIMDRQSQLQGERDSALAGYEKEMAKLQGGIQRDINRDQFGYQSDLSEQGYQQTSNLSTQQSQQQDERDQRLAQLDQEKARLDAELQEARDAGNLQREKQIMDKQAGIQKDRDSLLYDQERGLSDQSYKQQVGLLGEQLSNQQTLATQQGDIQAERDKRLGELDQESMRLDSELEKARANNNAKLEKELMAEKATIQEERDQRQFDYTEQLTELEQGNRMESMAKEYGLRGKELKAEAGRAMEKIFGSSVANAWGVTAQNVTQITASAQSSIQEINQMPDAQMDAAAKKKAIDEILSQRDTDIELQKSLYSSLSDDLMETGVFPEAGSVTGNEGTTQTSKTTFSDSSAAIETDSNLFNFDWSSV